MKLSHLYFLVFLPYIISTERSSPKIIIIGAGASGIATATRLLRNNFTNLVILEAENRIGGRIHSVRFGDAYIDMGAHWCHGVKDNIVYELVKDLNVLKATGKKPLVMFSSGEMIGEEFNSQLIDSISEVFGVPTRGIEDSVQDYYTAEYLNILFNKFHNNTRNLNLSLKTTRTLLQLIISLRGSFTLNDLIVDRDYKNCEGEQHLHWNGLGYKTVLETMIGSLPFYEKLKLNKEVVEVVWDGNDGSDFDVVVTTSDEEKIEGDFVVFTGSVGVLKALHNTIFKPALPREKVEAIDAIGFGAKMDASFYFPHKWWNGEMDDYYFVWNEEDIIEEIDNIRKIGSWILNLFYVISNPKNPNVLTVWFVGESVPEVELLSDVELTTGVMVVFKKFFGHVLNVTEPTDVIRSSWHNNKHFRGIYSYQTDKAHTMRPSAEIRLSVPTKNRKGKPVLHFAGEATHHHYYSTVHGAIESGFREADRIEQQMLTSR